MGEARGPLAGGADKSPGALSRTHHSALKKRWGRYQPIIPDTQSLTGPVVVAADAGGREGGGGGPREGAAGWGGSWHNLEITHVDSANSIKCKGEKGEGEGEGGIIWEEKIAAVTRRLSFGSFNSIEMAAAQLRGTEQPERRRREGKGELAVGGRGGPHPGPSAVKSSGSGRWQWQREEEVLGPAGNGPRPAGSKLSPALQRPPEQPLSWAPDNTAPASSGRRWQGAAGSLCSCLGHLMSSPPARRHLPSPLPSSTALPTKG